MKSSTPANLKRATSTSAAESKLSTNSSIHHKLKKPELASKVKKTKSKSKETPAVTATTAPTQAPAFYSTVRHTIPHLDIPGLGLDSDSSEDEYKPIKVRIKF